MNLNHAKHNEDLCRKLHNEKNFFDWILTIAFYSALHYSEHSLFPLQFGQRVYHSFDKYYQAFKMSNDNKHDARKRLIYSNIDASAGAAYSWLKDSSLKARYYDYKINELEADMAIRKLDVIKSYIIKSSFLKNHVYRCLLFF